MVAERARKWLLYWRCSNSRFLEENALLHALHVCMFGAGDSAAICMLEALLFSCVLACVSLVCLAAAEIELEVGFEAELEAEIDVKALISLIRSPSIRYAELELAFVLCICSYSCFCLCFCSCFCSCSMALLLFIPCSSVIPPLHTDVAAVIAEHSEAVSLSVSLSESLHADLGVEHACFSAAGGVRTYGFGAVFAAVSAAFAADAFAA